VNAPKRKLEVVTPVEYQTGGETKVFFQRLGTAVSDKTGEGFHVYLNGLPVNGKLWIRPIREREAR
jgi:hypothetical protein